MNTQKKQYYPFKPRYGSKNPMSKLTQQQVDQIRELKKQGKTNKEIAALYNVSSTTIGAIISGRSWKAQKSTPFYG